MSDLIVVLPACAKDAALMRKNLLWQIELGGCRNFKAVCAFGGDLPDAECNTLLTLARQCYAFVWRFDYPRARVEQWPLGPNHAFRQCAHFMATLKCPWFWFEPDVIPLKAGWLDALYAEYRRSGKKFMGTIVPEQGHCNGAAIYPADTPNLIPRTMLAVNHTAAWDVLMRPEMIHFCHDASHLIQHAWGVVAGRIHPHEGPAPTFLMPSDLNCIMPTAVVLHRNKDGTLIDRLRESAQKLSPIPTSQNATTDIFIRTYRNDAPWLTYALRSIRKFARGYQEVNLVFPEEDTNVITGAAAGFRCNLHPVENDGSKGYLGQQVSKLSADTFTKADYILFFDSDCFMLRDNSPGDWFSAGKINHLITPWSHVGDAKMWKEPTEKALGTVATHETMRRLPLLFPRGVVADCRRHIQWLHKKPIRDYILEQQSFSEFNALGTYAMRFAPNAFRFVDTTSNPLPPLVARQSWSYGGLTQELITDMENRLA